MNPTLPPFVQDLLDRGVDPLDDARTEEWLLAHPEALESFAALRRRLALLRQLPNVPRAPLHRRPLPWLLAAAAAAAALTALPLARPAAPSPPTAPPSSAPAAALPRPDLATDGDVVYLRVATTEREGTRTRQRVVEVTAPRDGARGRLDRRGARTVATFLDLPGTTPAWTVAAVTEHRTLTP